MRISRRQESSISPRPLTNVYSCLDEWLFLEDLPFDVSFDLSLFRTKSESALDDLVLDPKFIKELEVRRENQSVNQYLIHSPQLSLTTIKIPELSETTSTSFISPLFPHNFEVHSSSPLIPSLPHQPITTHQIPINPITPNLVLNPIQLRAMALKYSPLVMPTPQGVLPSNYESKIVLFDSIGCYTA